VDGGALHEAGAFFPSQTEMRFEEAAKSEFLAGQRIRGMLKSPMESSDYEDRNHPQKCGILCVVTLSDEVHEYTKHPRTYSTN
jgi:hypothetical protein